MSELGTKIEQANQEALRRLQESQAILFDLSPAREVIPGLTENTILHAGPPISWEKMCGPMQGAVLGALIYEGKAAGLKEAEVLATSGEINFSPCHHHQAVGPMAGIISPSMYVAGVKNSAFGNTAYATLNEGLGKVLRFGANSPEVIAHLKWMEEELAPALKKAVLLSGGGGGIDLKIIISQALQMGDECHNRNVAASNLFLKELLPYLLSLDLKKESLLKIVKFISANPHFFLNLSMAACKAATDTIVGLPYSTIMSAMARNGVELGIRVAALGERWFTAPAGLPQGLYFPGFSEKDANLDLGDSTISETAGIGAFAMAAAPAIVKFVGGSPNDAVRVTREMGEITAGRHKDFQIPGLDFEGTPLGVDIRKVVENQLTPFINTGIAHKEAGIGQIGAGILYAPVAPFNEALIALGEELE